MTPRRYVVEIREAGQVRTVTFSGDRRDIELLISEANRSPVNFARTYTLVAPFTLVRS